MFEKRLRLPLLVLLLSASWGCSKQLTVQPSLPSTRPVAPSQAKVGVYMKPTPAGSLDLGSGVWPKTSYEFSPRESMQGDLVALTKRHFPNSGTASDAVDDRWDYVIEYSTPGAAVDRKSLASRIPVTIAMRNPRSFQDVYSETIVGQSDKQPLRILDVPMGRVTERRALENSLNESAADLYVKLDGALARMAINESELNTQKPYQRKDAATTTPMSRSRRGGM